MLVVRYKGVIFLIKLFLSCTALFVAFSSSSATITTRVPASNSAIHSSTIQTSPTALQNPSVLVHSKNQHTDFEKTSDKIAPWAFGLSIFSILFTALNFGYGLKKDRKARKMSIVDDFWFRKIVTFIH